MISFGYVGWHAHAIVLILCQCPPSDASRRAFEKGDWPAYCLPSSQSDAPNRSSVVKPLSAKFRGINVTEGWTRAMFSWRVLWRRILEQTVEGRQNFIVSLPLEFTDPSAHRCGPFVWAGVSFDCGPDLGVFTFPVLDEFD
jgi:hypothetical protein